MPSRSTTGVLVSIKVLQLVGSLVCMVLHIVLYFLEPNTTPHITIFCGTFMGFTLVNLSFLISAAMGKPAAEELDMALGVLGGVLFYTCGILSMFFVKRENKKEREVGQLYFDLSRAQAMASLLTALIFVFDACLKFDMWNYERNKQKKNKTHEEEPPVLRLFCVDMGIFCYNKCRCCKCCNTCCEKYCKCCRPEEMEPDPDVSNVASAQSSVSRKSAPTITVEKYQERRNPKESVVVQRVEIEWLGKSGAIGEGQKRDATEASNLPEEDVSVTPSMTATSFLKSQKMTWPMSLHTMVAPELSLSKWRRTRALGAATRLPSAAAVAPETIPIASTSSCPLVTVPSAVPTISFQRQEDGRTSTIIEMTPSAALTMQSGDDLQKHEDTTTNAAHDVLKEIIANIPHEERVPNVEVMSSVEVTPQVDATLTESTLSSSEETSKTVRSRTSKEQ